MTKIRSVEKIAKFFELGLLTRGIFDQTTIFAKKKFLTLMQKKTFCQKLFFCQSLKNFAIFDSTTVWHKSPLPVTERFAHSLPRFSTSFVRSVTRLSKRFTRSFKMLFTRFARSFTRLSKRVAFYHNAIWAVRALFYKAIYDFSGEKLSTSYANRQTFKYFLRRIFV